MTKRMRQLYYGCIKNTKFISEITTADNFDDDPRIAISSSDKLFFAAVYYGWLVAKYGLHWEKHI